MGYRWEYRFLEPNDVGWLSGYEGRKNETYANRR